MWKNERQLHIGRVAIQAVEVVREVSRLDNYRTMSPLRVIVAAPRYLL